MTPLITIPLSEYEEIKNIKRNFQKAFDENKTILYHDTQFGHSGYPLHTYTVVNMDILTSELNDKLKKLSDENYKLKNELSDLKDKYKKSWF